MQTARAQPVRITFADARKGVRELDVTDAEAEKLGGRSVARRESQAQVRSVVGSDEEGALSFALDACSRSARESGFTDIGPRVCKALVAVAIQRRESP